MDRKYTIGVMIGNANSPHTMDLMQGIYQSAQKMDVNVLFFLGIHSRYYYRVYFGEDSDIDYDYQFNIVYDYSFLGKVDALIISYGSLGIFLEENDQHAFLQKYSHVPYVLLEDIDETGVGTSIIADNYNGMYEVVEHLVRDHGCREFTFLAGPEGNTDAAQRKQAFLDVLQKYQIPFDERRIAVGDYSECVQPQVNRLLDEFPFMDAMVCANDVMAGTVYKECERRGILVGRDIAVTGYDDWSAAESFNPPLTTVLQNAYNMGYMAVIGAIELCTGHRPHSIVIPAKVRYRNSCGCKTGRKEDFTIPCDIKTIERNVYLNRVANQILNSILLSNAEDHIRESIKTEIRQILEYDFTIKENKEKIILHLKRLLNDKIICYISPYILAKSLRNYINAWIDYCMREVKNHQTLVSVLIELKNEIQDAVLTHIIKETSDKFSTFQQESWFLPLISRDMINHMSDDKDFYGSTMVKLSALGLKNSYLYLFEHPIIHRSGDSWPKPEKMFLAAYHEGKNVVSFAEEERPVLTAENGFGFYRRQEEQFSLSIFCLFSGDTQYGILATEIEPQNLALSYLISMQIGNTLKYHYMSKEQEKTKRELEKLVQEIHEKNEILNFISEYDTLTGCLNRRGFLEKAVQMNKDNPGKEALIIFADLDHLKEINDCFGHMEGDFAIEHCASVIRTCAGEEGIVGRIGGDEFVAMILQDDAHEGDRIMDAVREANRKFNETSDKDYYIEASMGLEHFVCQENLSLTEILGKADAALYANKKKRRSTIKKHPDC